MPQLMPYRTQQSLIMGVLCAPVGFGVGLYLWWGKTEPEFLDASFALNAPLAAFVTAFGLWQLLFRLQKSRNVFWGMCAGGAAGILSHWVCWYLEFFTANVCYWLTGGCVSSLGEPPANLIESLFGATVMSIPSLLWFGPLTISLGILFGGILAGVQRRSAVQ
jgi:hypothetical protein